MFYLLILLHLHCLNFRAKFAPSLKSRFGNWVFPPFVRLKLIGLYYQTFARQFYWMNLIGYFQICTVSKNFFIETGKQFCIQLIRLLCQILCQTINWQSWLAGLKRWGCVYWSETKRQMTSFPVSQTKSKQKTQKTENLG